jgi:hypothetical protein
MELINVYQSDCCKFSYTAENNVTVFFDMRQLYDLTTGRSNSAPIGALVSYSVGGEIIAAGQRLIPNQFIIPEHKQILLNIGNFACIRVDGSYPFFGDQKGDFNLYYFTKDEVKSLNNTAIYCYG